VWADFGGARGDGSDAAAWLCGGREEQLVPRQRARVLFATQLEAEWLRFSRGESSGPVRRGPGVGGRRPCCYFCCPLGKKQLKVAARLLCIKKAINKVVPGLANPHRARRPEKCLACLVCKYLAPGSASAYHSCGAAVGGFMNKTEAQSSWV